MFDVAFATVVLPGRVGFGEGVPGDGTRRGIEGVVASKSGIVSGNIFLGEIFFSKRICLKNRG